MNPDAIIGGMVVFTALLGWHIGTMILSAWSLIHRIRGGRHAQ